MAFAKYLVPALMASGTVFASSKFQESFANRIDVEDGE